MDAGHADRLALQAVLERAQFAERAAAGAGPAGTVERATALADEEGLRIIAALVNLAGPAPEEEIVTLVNTSAAAPVDLNGWYLSDQQKHQLGLPLSASARATPSWSRRTTAFGSATRVERSPCWTRPALRSTVSPTPNSRPGTRDERSPSEASHAL